jgi:hypothetical protein
MARTKNPAPSGEGGELPESLRYFPFYAAEWLTAPAIRVLPAAARGALADLLAWSWRHDDCALPGDDATLARLGGLSPAEWDAVGPLVRVLLPAIAGDPAGRVRSPVLFARWKYARESYEARRGAAAARWGQQRPAPGQNGPVAGARDVVAAMLAARPALAAWAAAGDVRRALLDALADTMGAPPVVTEALADLDARIQGMYGAVDPAAVADAVADYLAKHHGRAGGLSAFRTFLNATKSRGLRARPATRENPALLGQSGAALARKYLDGGPSTLPETDE